MWDLFPSPLLQYKTGRLKASLNIPFLKPTRPWVWRAVKLVFSVRFHLVFKTLLKPARSAAKNFGFTQSSLKPFKTILKPARSAAKILTFLGWGKYYFYFFISKMWNLGILGSKILCVVQNPICVTFCMYFFRIFSLIFSFDCSTNPTPVSYTHLTLPTICSV